MNCQARETQLHLLFITNHHRHCRLLKTQQYLLSELPGVPCFSNNDIVTEPYIIDTLSIHFNRHQAKTTQKISPPIRAPQDQPHSTPHHLFHSFHHLHHKKSTQHHNINHSCTVHLHRSYTQYSHHFHHSYTQFFQGRHV